MTSGSRPYAAFDIDGTIIRWQIYHALFDELATTGKIPNELYESVKAHRRNWKNRAPDSSFKNYEQHLVRVYRSAIQNITLAEFNLATKTVFEEYKDQTYTYTRNLIKDLKARGYLLFALSGSQVEIVKMLAEYWGFDDYAGTQQEHKKGFFTDKAIIMRDAQKTVELTKMVSKHNAISENSIAIGDSESDIPFLQMVDKPIAFNPSAELLSVASMNGWDVVLERKNVVYTLEYNIKQYYLKHQGKGVL